MARDRTRHSRRSGSGFNKGYLLWGLGFTIFIAILTFMFFQPEKTNLSDFCPKSGEKGKIVILLDVSDPLNMSQKAKLKKELDGISKKSSLRPKPLLNKGEKLVIYITEEDGKEPNKLFSMCSPGDIENKKVIEKMSEGKIISLKKWQNFQNKALNEIENKLSDSTSLKTSPIIESLSFVRAQEFNSPELLEESTNNKIIMISDFIQNSALTSQFKTLENVQEVNKIYPVSLNNISIRMLMLVSNKYSKFQTPEHQSWWRKYFAITGADLERISLF